MARPKAKPPTIGNTHAFLGNFPLKVLSGYRIVLPAPYKKVLNTGVVLTKGLENNLYVFDLNNWQKIISPLTNANFLHTNIRKLLRYLSAWAFILEPDKQGRIVIPQPLRSIGNHPIKAGDSLIMAGIYNWAEIWREPDWYEHTTKLKKSIHQLSDDVAKLIDSTNE